MNSAEKVKREAVEKLRNEMQTKFDAEKDTMMQRIGALENDNHYL